MEWQVIFPMSVLFIYGGSKYGDFFQLVCLLNGRVEDEVSMTLFCVEYALSLSFYFVFSIKTSLKLVVLLVSKRTFVFLFLY